MKNFITHILKKNTTYIIIGILFILLIWFITSNKIDNEIIFPKISSVIRSLTNILNDKWAHNAILNTTTNLLYVILISLIISLILASLASYSSKIEEIIKPSIVLIKTIPVAVIIILLLIIIGRNKSPLMITLLVVLPLMYELILAGFKSIDKTILEEIKMTSSTNLLIIRRIYVPLTAPYIITSIIQSVGLGLKVMVMAEYITQPKNTIGYILQQEREMINISNVFAWAFILIVFVLITEISIKKAKKHFEKRSL
jgi:NitT/TauT family transport system permease protein